MTTLAILGLADTKCEFTSYSFGEIVASTLARAEKVIVAAGGTLGPDHVLIPAQSPQAPPLEQWDPGVPVARVEFGEPAWSRRGTSGEWDEASFNVECMGVVIVGTMTQEGGRADVYLDGAKAGEIDAWIPERTHDNDYWHSRGCWAGLESRRGRGCESAPTCRWESVRREQSCFLRPAWSGRVRTGPQTGIADPSGPGRLGSLGVTGRLGQPSVQRGAGPSRGSRSVSTTRRWWRSRPMSLTSGGAS